ncbi:MAG: selenocysteine-specific translation elongation factor [Vicinamibacterales bacterium]
MKHIVIGTAGHIDHGKSSLVMALTGTDPDRLKEEKARGITIDLGFAHWEAPGLSVAFIDVPGHERFVKNMLAGVGGLDAVMLVIAADESVMPQTREHFEICRLLQVPAGLVVLTKIDAVEREMLDLVRADVEELVAGSFLETASVVAVSARSGEGLDALKAALAGIGASAAGRREDGPVRLPVDRVFSMRGFGTVVTGTLVGGRLDAESAAVVLPGERAVKVRGVQVHGQRVARAVAGQRVAVNLGGVDTGDLLRGQTLATPGAFSATRVIDVRLEVLGGSRALRHGARLRFHQGTSEVLGRVAVSSVAAGGEAGDGEAAQAAEIPPGRSAYARLRLEGPVVVTRGDRFIVRAYSPPDTIGGGLVLDPHPPRGGIRTAAGQSRFAALDPATSAAPAQATERAALLLSGEAGQAGLPRAALTARLGLLTGDAREPVERLLERGALTAIGAVLVAPAQLDGIGRALIALAEAHHREHPMEEGIPREEARVRACGRAAPGVFERVVEELVGQGRITATDRIGVTGRRTDTGGAEAAAREAIAARYREAGLRPADLAALAESFGMRPAQLADAVAWLVRQKTLVRVGALVFHENALRALKADVASLKAASPDAAVTLDVAAFKDRYGMSRKYAIPLLEYLDRERVTRRVGDSRMVI